MILLSIPTVLRYFSPVVIVEMLPTTHKEIKLEDFKILPPKPAELVVPAVKLPAPDVVVKLNPAEVIPTVKKDELVTQPPVATNDPLADITPPDAILGPDAITSTNTDLTTTVSGTDSGKTAALPTKPFFHAEVMPEFVGGPEALQRYMQRNLRFPSRAASAAISGRVYISFTVNADGTITDVTVIKGLGYGTDEEAVRVVSKMPAWTPGKQNQHPVAVRYTMPITFQYQ
jgi:protein TonB